jgi:hypothetical protein
MKITMKIKNQLSEFWSALTSVTCITHKKVMELVKIKIKNIKALFNKITCIVEKNAFFEKVIFEGEEEEGEKKEKLLSKRLYNFFISFFKDPSKLNAMSFTSLSLLVISLFITLEFSTKIILFFFSYNFIKHVITTETLQDYLIDIVRLLVDGHRLDHIEVGLSGFDLRKPSFYNFHENYNRHKIESTFNRNKRRLVFYLNKGFYNFYSVIIFFNIIFFNYKFFYLAFYLSSLSYFYLFNFPSFFITLFLIAIITIRKLFLISESELSYEEFTTNLYENNPEIKGKEIKLTYRNIVLLKLWIFRNLVNFLPEYVGDLDAYFYANKLTLEYYKISLFCTEKNSSGYKMPLEIEEEEKKEENFIEKYFSNFLFAGGPGIFTLFGQEYKIKQIGTLIDQEKIKIILSKTGKVKNAFESHNVTLLRKNTEKVLDGHVFKYEICLEKKAIILKHFATYYKGKEKLREPSQLFCKFPDLIQHHSSGDPETATVSYASFQIPLDNVKAVTQFFDLFHNEERIANKLKEELLDEEIPFYKKKLFLVKLFSEDINIKKNDAFIDHNNLISFIQFLEANKKDFPPSMVNEFTTKLVDMINLKADYVEISSMEVHNPGLQSIIADISKDIKKKECHNKIIKSLEEIEEINNNLSNLKPQEETFKGQSEFYKTVNSKLITPFKQISKELIEEISKIKDHID